MKHVSLRPNHLYLLFATQSYSLSANDIGSSFNTHASPFQRPPTKYSVAITALLFCKTRPLLTSKKLLGSSSFSPEDWSAFAPSADWTGVNFKRSLGTRCASQVIEPAHRRHMPS